MYGHDHDVLYLIGNNYQVINHMIVFYTYKEAARMWTKREQEWQREKEERESLMADVLAERQHQLNERLENLKIRQQESIEEREKLLRDIEISLLERIERKKTLKKQNLKN